MKIGDTADYFLLRRTLANAWDFVWERKHPRTGELLPLRFRDGRVFYLRSGTRDRHIFHRLYLKDEYGVRRAGLRDLGCVIDIGAQIGIFSFLVAPLASRVVSFEPVNEHYELMARNLASPQYSHVTCVHAAVAGKHAGNGPEGASVVTLGEIFENYGIERCDLLKIDCEGAEYEILFAATNELLSRILRISLEYHEFPSDNPRLNRDSLKSYLEKAGFKIEVRPRKRNKDVGIMLCKR